MSDEARQASGAALEAEAVTMWRQYGFFMPKPAKQFFNRLSDFLGWQTLGALTK